jgi:TctA family transporter
MHDLFGALLAADIPQATDLLTTLDRWSMLVGTFLPLLIAVVNRQRWAGWAKLLMASVACLAASAVTVYLNGKFDTRDWVGSLILVAFFAFASYQWAWKPSGVAPKIESATG